ncbi:MAG: PepSY-like domain-containing protein [Prolixibacteraceae bacterium]
MKNLLTVLVCMIFVVGTYAQKPKEDAPAAAKSAFAAKYPAAQKVKWSVEKPGEFEVDFILNKVESSALFDASGKFLESETEVSNADLPAAVKAILAKDFAGYKLDEITKATDTKGVVTYEMQAAKGKDKLSLDFDATGKLLSKAPLKKESEEK